MSFQNIIRTKRQGSAERPVLEYKRRKRILEALSWNSGTQDIPIKHIVATLPNGTEVYFLKPGKEVFNEKRPNPNDMLPVVKTDDLRLKFDDIWAQLSRISVINFEYFKAVLTLVYRNAYFLDHVENPEGVIRYSPNTEVQGLIADIESEVGNSPLSLLELLNFLDVLGWNEDMKYHVENGKPTFSGHYNFNVGRINTLLTCIRVPYQAAVFVTHCLGQVDDKRNIDFSSLFTIMQQFAKSRGTCTPTQLQLLDWLSPYLFNSS